MQGDSRHMCLGGDLTTGSHGNIQETRVRETAHFLLSQGSCQEAGQEPARLGSHVFMVLTVFRFFVTVPADVASPESGSKCRCIPLL